MGHKEAVTKLARNSIYALDLGTTKFCLARLLLDETGHPFDIDLVSVPAAGMRRGMVGDFSLALETLRKLLTLAENQFDASIDKVAVGVAGTHLKSRILETEIAITSATITRADVARLEQKIREGFAQTQKTSENRELLHCVALEYQVDGRPPVENPLDLSGLKISARFFLLDSDKSYLHDIVRLCNESGMRISSLHAELMASAAVSLDPLQRDLGVCLADVGGGTTDVLVTIAGKPQACFTLNIGGMLMTKDLAIGLNTSPEDAERAKLTFGLEESFATSAGEYSIEIRDVKSRVQNVGWQQVFPILAARCEELCVKLKKHLQPYYGSLGGGIVFTGGGADVRGFEDFAENIFELPVTRTKPDFAMRKAADSSASKSDSSEVLRSGRFATILGILYLEMTQGQSLQTKSVKSPSAGKTLTTFIRWIKELS